MLGFIERAYGTQDVDVDVDVDVGMEQMVAPESEFWRAVRQR